MTKSTEINYAYSSNTLPRARKQRKPLYEVCVALLKLIFSYFCYICFLLNKRQLFFNRQCLRKKLLEHVVPNRTDKNNDTVTLKT